MSCAFRPTLAAGLPFVLLCGWCGTSFGQSQSLFGNQGPLGTSRTGTSSPGTAVPRPNTMVSPAFGMGGASNSGMGNTGGQAGGFGNQGFGGQGQAMGAGQRQGLVGRSDNSGRLVGSNQGGAQGNAFNAGQGMNARGGNTRRPSGATADQSPNQLNSQNQAPGGARATKTVKPQHRVAFSYPAPSAPQFSQNLTVRFQKIASKLPVKGMQVEFDAGQVTLRGEVDSAETGRLAEQFARLEPGVRTVRNEFVIRKQPSSAAK